jgi:predicted DNA-binding transcriptional regulator YafY
MKPEEIIPEVIKRLSKGESLSTKEIADEYGVIPSSFNDKFRPIREEFYEHFIAYDKSSGKWIRIEPLFLEKMLLTPEETVVLTALIRNTSMCGTALSSTVKEIVENYVKRTKSSVFKQDILEKINDDLEIVFAQLKYAIEERKKIKFTYNKQTIIFYPYKVINLEYYWYILGYEEYSEYWMEMKKKPENSHMIKTFTINKIRSLEVIDETYKFDFSKTETELKHAMNAFFSVDGESEIIELLVIEWLEEYIERAPYFSGWKKTGEVITIKNDKRDENDVFLVYEIKSTNKYYQDVIPTILKYMPNIRIKDNQNLIEKIFDGVKVFTEAHGGKDSIFSIKKR